MRESSARAALAALIVLGACETRSAPAPSATASAAVAVPPPPAATTAPPPAPDADRLEILKLRFTSEVRDKEPVDRLLAAGPGQRVWAHVTVRNRTGETRPLELIFKVDGKVRSSVDLEVESSWSFRTWGYSTMRDDDRTGALVVEVRSDGEPITEATLPIRARPEAAKR